MTESRDGGGQENQFVGEGNIQIMTHFKCSWLLTFWRLILYQIGFSVLAIKGLVFQHLFSQSSHLLYVFHKSRSRDSVWNPCMYSKSTLCVSKMLLLIFKGRKLSFYTRHLKRHNIFPIQSKAGNEKMEYSCFKNYFKNKKMGQNGLLY